jgi:outer membrane receptor protein involved in Fe transport
VHGVNEVVGVPSVVANADVGTAVPGLPSLVARFGVEYTGRYYLDDANRTAVTPGAVLSATLELRDHLFARNGVGVRGFLTVQNLANRTYVGSAFLNPDVVGGEPVAYEPGAPRSLVLSLSVGRLD